MDSNILKQAKDDIFKELYKIINFYIKKGAKPENLKRYYKSNKRFNDILEDIKNKAINLFDDEKKYKETVKDILYDIINDSIAKEKDNKNNKNKMKHIKEFFNFNSGVVTWSLNIGAITFLSLFVRGLLKNIKRKSEKTIDDKKQKFKDRIYDLETKVLYNLSNQIKHRLEVYEGSIKLTEDIVYYIIIIECPDSVKDYLLSVPLIMKIHKHDSILKYGDHESVDSCRPIQLTRNDVEELISGLKEDIEYRENN